MSSRCAKITLAGLLLTVPLVFEAHAQKPPQEILKSPGDISKSERSPLVAGRQNYVGDEACRACHLDKTQSYWKTAHHLSSRLPTKESILGSFAEGKNIFRTSNPGLYFRMDSKADGFYQSSFLGNPPGTRSHTERFDVVIGSGRVGQTYLFWKNDDLFQLPVSYWVDLDSWINSPGYRDGVERFERPVAPRCLECHLTYAESEGSSGQENKYKPGSLVLGISCERCHGPGREHVDAMTSGKGTPAILHLTKLTRELQMDVCAQCHGGRRIATTVPFSYVPGEPLDNYYSRVAMDPGAMVDVHGNQVALLQMSRCYQSSPDLVCSTCHDVHQPQRDAAGFSTFCLKCHRPEACGEFPRLKEKITESCIDCHMPVQSSNLIVSNSNGKKVRAMVRSHWIKIYPSAQNP
ncbi:MAG TPA: multiheme c-type cytochrome [Candidatus Acidoferrum sp.]|nr:multiheme c-type cytochrome [Candidatus Acidoferrum sp.]